MKKILILAVAMLQATLGLAQPDTLDSRNAHSFQLNGQHWTRGEWRYGALPSETGEKQARFLMSSTALTLNYKYKGLEMQVTPRHSGIWGAKGGGGFSLDEGWIALRSRGGLFVKVGRQKLSYDDQRVIGDNDWAMTPSKHDLLRAGFELPRHKLHLLLAFNQNSENTNGGTYYTDGGQPYKSLQTLWYHVDPFPQLGASLIFMNTGMQDLMAGEENLVCYQQLFGGFLDFHPGNFSLQASYYRQTGRDEHEMAVGAWMTSAEAVWQILPRLRLNTGYFHLSGDEYFFVPPEGALGMARKTEVHGFNPIFGSHHQFYGAMDFFYVTTYYGGNTPGLQDYHFGIRWKPVERLSLESEYHCLATSVRVDDASRLLGHEVELELSWNLMKDVNLQAGYSFMYGTPTMELLKRSSDRNRLRWGWLMLLITPEFFSTKF